MIALHPSATTSSSPKNPARGPRPSRLVGSGTGNVSLASGRLGSGDSDNVGLDGSVESERSEEVLSYKNKPSSVSQPSLSR
jgi:hypothetical protein